MAVHSINRAFPPADCHALVCDGERVVVLPADERMINIYEKVEALPPTRVSWLHGLQNRRERALYRGRSLCGAFCYTETLRHWTSTGAFSYPKYAEYDDCYAGQLPFSAVGLFVPANVSGDGFELRRQPLPHYATTAV